jgi:hypothetical protein
VRNAAFKTQLKILMKVDDSLPPTRRLPRQARDTHT